MEAVKPESTDQKVPGSSQDNYGSNALVFDNYSIVPEPSAPLMLGLAALGLASRRRRQA